MKLDGFKQLTKKQQEFVSKHYPLINAFLKKNPNVQNLSQQEIEEFISYMHISLCSSAMKFDEEQGFKPSTYVWGGFSLSLINYLEDKSRESRLPILNKIYKVENKVEKNINNKLESENIYALIDKVDLSDKEMYIIKRYYIESDLSLCEIGEILGMSKENTRRIKEKALRKIYKYCCFLGIEFSDF